MQQADCVYVEVLMSVLQQSAFISYYTAVCLQ